MSMLLRGRMKLSVLLLVFAFFLVDKSEGWGSWRKAIEKLCSTVCTVKCTKACPVCLPVCHNVCERLCSKKKKREVSGSLSLPCTFASWDTNGDGHVDLDEFSSTAFSAVEHGDLTLAFQATDADGNQKISKEELYKAKFLLIKC